MLQKNKIIYSGIILFFLAMNIISCKKWIVVDPPVDKPDASVIYSNDALATTVMTGLYNQLSAGSFATGSNSISIRAGLSADELTGYSASGNEAFAYYQNAIPNSTITFWSDLYKYIYTCNSSIEGINASSQLHSDVRNQLLGEAKFMRAFLHFYLVNLYGDVPLVLTTNYKMNSLGTRIPKKAVYEQIIEDLNEAQSLLVDSFVALNLKSTTSERIRPNRGAAAALLSRVYLYSEDYANAELQATKLISNVALYDTVSLSQVFLKNSKEAIWQLQPVVANINTQDARAFILTAAPNSSQPASISPQLYSAFEVGDQRKSKWIKTASFSGTTYYSPYKYQVYSGSALTEYHTLLRLAEQYLIRAEARVQQDNIAGALTDLNIIRKRAGLSNITTTDKLTLLSKIEKERQVELFSEWGNRWLDLKRTNRVDAVMDIITPLKGGGAWQSYKQLYPIPQRDIEQSGYLIQNDGY